jgi:hypothetical protein
MNVLRKFVLAVFLCSAGVGCGGDNKTAVPTTNFPAPKEQGKKMEMDPSKR